MTGYFAKRPLTLFCLNPQSRTALASRTRTAPALVSPSLSPLPLSLLPRRRAPLPHLAGALPSSRLLPPPCRRVPLVSPNRLRASVASLPSVFRRRHALVDEKIGPFGPSRRGIAESGGCEAGSGGCEAGSS